MLGLKTMHFILFCLFIFWLLWVFIATIGLSPVAVSGGCSLVSVYGLLTAMVSLVAEHELWVLGLQALIVAVHKLSCSERVGSSRSRD